MQNKSIILFYLSHGICRGSSVGPGLTVTIELFIRIPKWQFSPGANNAPGELHPDIIAPPTEDVSNSLSSAGGVYYYRDSLHT